MSSLVWASLFWTACAATRRAIVSELLLSLRSPMRLAVSGRLLLLLLLLWSSCPLLVRLVIGRSARVVVLREVAKIFEWRVSVLELRSLRLRLLFSLHLLLNVVEEGLELEHLLLVAVEVGAHPASMALVRVVSIVAREEHILRLLVRRGVLVVEVGMCMWVDGPAWHLLGLLRIVLLPVVILAVPVLGQDATWRGLARAACGDFLDADQVGVDGLLALASLPCVLWTALQGCRVGAITLCTSRRRLSEVQSLLPLKRSLRGVVVVA